MLKKVLCALFIFVSAIGASAEYMNIDFTYADDTYGTWGKSKNETYDVAMAINNPAFAGKKITSVSALISTVSGIEDISLWLSSELKLENKANVPDIVSMRITREPVTLPSGLNAIKISATLPEPYVLTGSPVYVGYSLTVTDFNQTGAGKPVIVSNTTNPDGFYMHASKSVIKWKSMVESTGVNACIYATIEGELDPYSVSIVSMPEMYVVKGDSFSVASQLCNAGAESIDEIEYSYEVAGVTKNGKVTLKEPLVPDIMSSQIVELSFDGIAEAGPYDMSVTIGNLNGKTNAAIVPFGNCHLNIMPFMPVKRPMLEDFEGMIYGYSPRSYIALKKLDEEFGDDVVLASYHMDDPLMITYDYPVEINGLPSGTIDRSGDMDSYYGTFPLAHDFGIKDNMLELMDRIPMGDINVSAAWSDDKKNIDVISDVRFVRAFDDAYYELGYILTANGLHGEGKEWEQYNKFSGDPYYKETGLKEAYEWPEYVSGLIYDNVVVDLGAYKGLENSLPYKIEMGKVYNHRFTFVDVAYNEVIEDFKNIDVIAFILDKYTGQIVNAKKTHVLDAFSGVESQFSDNAEIIDILYYDLTGRRVTSPSNGVFIKVCKKSDGSSESSKIVVR